VRKIYILAILTLIISTTLIKNYTKKLDEEIFAIKENINYLNSIQELVQLEYNYLSSPEKILELNNLYFNGDLKHISRENLIFIDDTSQINFENIYKNE
tara:strand:- start:3524 stop:3820 length:297 start_codon:yes stop_codon:yes gene_type:complete